MLNLDQLKTENAERRKRKEAATEGPWRHEPYEGSHESAVIGGGYQIATIGYDGFAHTNAAFISAARNDPVEDVIDALIAEVERLRRGE